jgi:ElaA protein
VLPETTPAIETVRGDRIDAPRLQAVLALRVAVFVVEQRCPYQEIDGRDTEPGTWHAWIDGGPGVLSYLRVLTDAGRVRRVGRVCTAEAARGRGLSARLMAAALTEIGSAASVLDAQTYVRGFYERFGYVARGAEFLEDGIPHITMHRAAG